MAFSRWAIVLAILSVVVTIIAVAATGFVVEMLAKVTSSSGGTIATTMSEIIGAIVIFVISYLYSKREIKRRKSSKTRLRQKEKDFFREIEDSSPSKGELR